MADLVIKPRQRAAINVRELWAYRELVYFFAWRDLKVRYKQTITGASWAIIQPFVTMVVFTLFFNKVAGIKSGGIPYAIFSYAGLLFWIFFSSSLTQVSNSLVANQAVITKIYFPRIILTISATLICLVDLFFAFIIFVGLLIYYRIAPDAIGVLLVLPMVLLSLVTSLGVGSFFAALNVKYRDIRSVLPFVIQLGLFLTPVIYPVSLIPGRFRWLVGFNPMASVVNTMRAGLLHQGSIDWGQLALSTAVALVLLAFGLSYFQKTQHEFADVI